jgi:hypothetical protein
MSIYSYADAKKYLDEALEARSATLKSQRYKVANREQQRVELQQLTADITKWEDELKEIYAANPKLNPNYKKIKTRRGPTVSILGCRA